MSADFTRRYINLAQPALGADVISASDEFFGSRDRLIKPETAVFLPDEYDDHGKWMDGWETRRKRHEGFDHCILKLGMPGLIRGFDIDTSFFVGNYPPSVSIDVCLSDKTPDETTSWTRILPSASLEPDAHNLFEVDNDFPWNYVRLNIYPDGGVARLRIYGEVVPDWENVGKDDVIDLLALENGGRALMCNDEHFGSMHNLIKPTPPLNMGDGWETRRRRDPGYDWAILSLGCLGEIEKIRIETTFFKGNYPDSCSIQAALVKGGSEETMATQSLFWPELLSKSYLQADTSHTFTDTINDIGPVSHIRINVFPDGGISRLRLYGRVKNLGIINT
jgi:allantoicase